LTQNHIFWGMITMTFTRMAAAFIVFLLIGVLALAGVAGTAWLGPIMGHGTNVMHTSGKVVEVGPGKNFVLLETKTGTKKAFTCGTDCRASTRHLQRHLKEGANTDVYYVLGANQVLVAKDAD
jgi:hypothetical protein